MNPVLLEALMRIRPAPLAVILKRILGVKRIEIDTPQGRYWIDPASTLGFTLSRQGTYERSVERILAEFLGTGKVFVDLGANEGYFTVQGARLTSPGGRVLAIEPQSRLIPILERNLRLNGLSNVTVVQAAISDNTGTGTLHLAPDTNPGSSSLHRTTKYPLRTQKVEMLTLADVLERHGIEHVDFMKVDIESFEYEAILGSPRVFNNRRVKALFVEWHNSALSDRGKSVSDITSFLKSAGYQTKLLYGKDAWITPA